MDTTHHETPSVQEDVVVKDDRAWDDIVFENRNREYGAYVLRKDYGNNVLFAFTMTLLLAILAIVLSV